MSIESKVYLDLARIWNLGPGEVETIVRDYIGAVTCDYDRFNSPPPPIYIGPVKVETLKERLDNYKKHKHIKEDNKMKATSTEEFKDIIAIDFELQTFPNLDVQDKFIVSATNRDDIFCFVFEGPNLRDACRNSGLFTGWEKDRKIQELEEELGRWKKEAADCLRLRDEAQKEAYKLKQQLQEAGRDKKNLRDKYEFLDRCYKGLLKDNKNLIKCKESLKSDMDLERAANEAQRKFIKEYAGNDTEVTFNYAIDSVSITYGLYDKDYIDELRKDIHDLVAENTRLEALKTPTIENFADEEPSSRRDILRCAEKCVCGHREQDYGSPESNFQLIADLWNQYLFKEPGAKEVFGIGPMDVSMMMALMKIARIRNGGGSGDSFVDLAGYAACGGEIWHSNKGTNIGSN